MHLKLNNNFNQFGNDRLIFPMPKRGEEGVGDEQPQRARRSSQ